MNKDRFKFRIWDKHGNSYISEKDDADFVYLGEEGNITVGLYNGDLEDMMCLKEEDLIIEQCTGLKDKNGRLIYEGDIVKYTFYGQPGLYGDYGYKGVIRWETNGFNTRSWADEIEVIGNIHENP